MELSWVAQVGTVELAFGALSGWIVALSVDSPEKLRQAGVKAVHRIRQAHLDFIIMGILLIAAGLAVPELNTFWQVLLVAGAWVNPALFVPLAFRPDTQHTLWYRTITLMSFTAMSVGTVAVAVTAVSG